MNISINFYLEDSYPQLHIGLHCVSIRLRDACVPRGLDEGAVAVEGRVPGWRHHLAQMQTPCAAILTSGVWPPLHATMRLGAEGGVVLEGWIGTYLRDLSPGVPV